MQATQWTSDSMTRGLASAAVSTYSKPVVVTAAGRPTVALISGLPVSFDAVTPSSVVRANAASTAGVSVTVVGMSGAMSRGSAPSGYSGSVRLGGTRLPATMWISSSILRGKTAATSTNVMVLVQTMGLQHSSVTQAISKDLVGLSGFANRRLHWFPDRVGYWRWLVTHYRLVAGGKAVLLPPPPQALSRSGSPIPR